ncbi:hypothetical protein CBS101457_003725 [Exobasidium rhododendri]|nr:hypothetical protein CBS101457_003725 [Exobasidium rhododendri]
MDFDDIGSRLANLTMYDVKQLYTTAKNYALNISEIEAKVNEATSDDPWGASSTLMQEIAAATQNFQDFNEIMPAIYRNFMEKEAREWRQIYKALQLLEYLTKHGSERVVDDARSHLGTIKILRNFHYIDEAGKDQGLNVRNRAKEIAELLSDVERIRQERRKARANKQKYQGASNSDFVPGSGSGRYGGFGSESAYGGGGYNGGSGGGGGGSSSAPRRESFDEYDAGEDDDGGRKAPAAVTSTSRRNGGHSSGAKAAPPKKQEKVVDLFSFDDDEPAPTPASKANVTSAAPIDAFDDFDDFQAAPSAAPVPSSRPAASIAAASASKNAKGSVFDFLGEGDLVPAPSAQPSLSAARLTPSTAPLQPQRSISGSTAGSAVPPKGNASSLNFDDLWATSAGKSSTTNSNDNKGKMTMAEMAKQKSSSAVWGGSTPQQKKSDPFDFL